MSDVCCAAGRQSVTLRIEALLQQCVLLFLRRWFCQSIGSNDPEQLPFASQGSRATIHGPIDPSIDRSIYLSIHLGTRRKVSNKFPYIVPGGASRTLSLADPSSSFVL